MKILLSAYACEPGKGSEPAVGWNWALALSRRGHDVWVVTRSNNRPSIEAQLARQSVTFTAIYYDLPTWCRRWKRLPGGLYFYYLLWQMGAYLEASKIHRYQSFEIVQHITFVTFRQPSFMGRLGIPFLLGPVGGGEASPPKLREGLNASGRVREKVRELLIHAASFDPLMHQTFRRASLIACTTGETLARIPSRYQAKCMVLPAIGIDAAEMQLARPSVASTVSSSADASAPPAFLFIGRLLYWKGLHLILRAMPEVLRQLPDARLKIVGEGPDADWLHRVAEECGVSAQIDWVSAMPHSEIAAAYGNHVAFVFPSLHDSGGLVVLESLAAGLPVICLALGGPGVFVDASCGIVIDTVGRSPRQVQQQIAAAMMTLAQQKPRRDELAANCVPRARRFSWDSAAETLYRTFASRAGDAGRSKH